LSEASAGWAISRPAVPTKRRYLRIRTSPVRADNGE
jgi:hypothetical protein